MNDFLVRFAQGDAPAAVHREVPSLSGAESETPTADPRHPPFRTPSLQWLAPDSAVREQLGVLRIDSKVVPTSSLVTFGARNRSLWGLDALSQRLTKGLLDWAGLRAELVHAVEAKRDYEPILERITPNNLWLLRQMLTSHHLDEEAERVLLVMVADRVLAGEDFDRNGLATLAVNLVGAGLVDRLRQLLRIYTADSYVRHALTVELEHPRFGGSHEMLLARFNQVYRRFGLEAVGLTGSGSTPFTKLRAEPTERLTAGPLVTVIMSCWSPGEELLLAARSIVDQSYQNWELLVTDDASPDQHDAVLDQVAAMDARIRVIRNEINAGTYVRRNEALALARGEFVTMQDSDDWSHPRRLEIQIRDLQAAPERFANIVRNVRLTEDLSLHSERGMQLGVCEPAILFRREAVLDRIGYFDSIRKAADREFRERLEAVTGVPVATVGPEVPLVLMLADVSSLSGSDFRGKWVHPARIAYRSSMHRFHGLIKDGEQEARIPARQETRTLDAPAPLLGHSNAPHRVDLLVVLDGRPTPARRQFLAEVVWEVRHAIEAGVTVGILHSDSLTGGNQQGYFDVSMQRLVDEGGLHRIIDDQQIEAGTVVVRHSIAAQGHPAERKPISTARVVVIEDRDGGDERGVTFARRDVLDTTRAWFDVAPEWLVAKPRRHPPTVQSVAVAGDDLRVAITHAFTVAPTSIVLGQPGGKTIPLRVERYERLDDGSESMLAVGRVPLAEVGSEKFEMVALIDSHAYRLEADAAQVLPSPTERLLVRRPHGRLQWLTAGPSEGAHGSEEFREKWLRGAVAAVRFQGKRVVLEISTSGEARLTDVAVVREALGGVIRRRGFALESSDDGVLVATRSVEDVAGPLWQIYGVFRTPIGVVQHPLALESVVLPLDGAEWRVRTPGGRFQIVSAASRDARKSWDGLRRRLTARR